MQYTQKSFRFIYSFVVAAKNAILAASKKAILFFGSTFKFKFRDWKVKTIKSYIFCMKLKRIWERKTNFNVSIIRQFSTTITCEYTKWKRNLSNKLYDMLY